MTNTGNGDDTYSIELADNLLEGWQISPTSSTLTISKDDQRTQQFSIFAPESFTQGEIEATVTVTSEDGQTSETISVNIPICKDFAISRPDSISRTHKVYESQPRTDCCSSIKHWLQNRHVVLVSVNLTNDAGNEVVQIIGNQTISVGAGQTVNATFALDESAKKFNRFAITVDVLGEDISSVERNVEPFDYQEETILDTSEPTSAWFMIVIIALTILVGYGGLKVARNKGSTRF